MRLSFVSSMVLTGLAMSITSSTARSEQISEYICGTDVQNGIESTNVGITLLSDDFLIQAIGKHDSGKLKSLAGVVSSLRALGEAKYGHYTPDQLLNETDSPLGKLAPKQKSFLRAELANARRLQANQTLTPGKPAIFDVVIVERPDSYNKLVWTLETKKTIVDEDGRLRLKGSDDTMTFLDTDEATGLMVATSYLKFPNFQTEGETYFGKDSAAVLESYRDSGKQRTEPIDPPKSPMRVGDKLLPRVGENIGKNGTMTFDAKFLSSGAISEVQFRVANLPTRVEKKESPGPVLEMLNAQKATFTKFAACCKNDSPAECIIRFRPASPTSPPALAPKAPTKR